MTARPGLGWLAAGIAAYGVARMASFARHRAPRVAGPWDADVVAVVPARDEARTVGRCVRALLANGVREVVVVDDGSSDGTAAAATEAGARVVTAGIDGKAGACLTGASATSGEWLWFADADVAVADDALARLLAHADETGASLVSALGRVATPTLTSAWLMPEVGLSLARAVDLHHGTFASGQCLLVRRAAYDATGGHDVTAVAEDVALAKALTRRGLVVETVLAPDLYETTMYATLGDAWRGLVKNAVDVPRSRAADAYAVATLLGGPAGYAAGVVVSAGGRAVSRAPVWPAVAAPFAEAWLALNRYRSRRRGPVLWKGRLR